MKSKRIRIWRFAEAPQRLRALYTGSRTLDWLTLVPHEIDEEFNRVIAGNEELAKVWRLDGLTNGDAVYVGTSHAAGAALLAFIHPTGAARIADREGPPLGKAAQP